MTTKAKTVETSSARPIQKSVEEILNPTPNAFTQRSAPAQVTPAQINAREYKLPASARQGARERVLAAKAMYAQAIAEKPDLYLGGTHNATLFYKPLDASISFRDIKLARKVFNLVQAILGEQKVASPSKEESAE